MKKQFILISLVILGFVSGIQASFGQSTQQVATLDKYPNLKLQAQALSDATVNRDFDKLVDLTHPTIVSYFGGRERMIAAVKQIFETNFDNQGVKLLSFRHERIEQEAKIENDLYVVFSETVLIQINGAKYEGEGTEIAISSDNGSSWKFVSGTTGQATFDRLFPKASGKIKLKEVGAPRKID